MPAIEIRMHTHYDRREVSSRVCRGCPIQDCPAGDGRDESLPSGRRLGLSAMGLFLGPGVLAIVGAMCFGESGEAQLLGGVAGLVLGMTGSVVLARLPRGVDKAESTKKGA